ncbi:MAG TPA: protein kinase, partial [Polyangiaceae bacterium]
MRPRTDKIAAPERQVELLELIGATLGGKYKLERLLGAGGMGGVYAAWPLTGGAQVAIKVLSVADPASRDRIAARFAREARAVSALSCPNIVTVLDAGSVNIVSPLSGDTGTRPYLVMELLEGEDLGQRLRRDG